MTTVDSAAKKLDKLLESMSAMQSRMETLEKEVKQTSLRKSNPGKGLPSSSNNINNNNNNQVHNNNNRPHQIKRQKNNRNSNKGNNQYLGDTVSGATNTATAFQNVL